MCSAGGGSIRKKRGQLHLGKEVARKGSTGQMTLDK